MILFLFFVLGWELSEKQHDLGYSWVGTKMSSVEGPDLQPVQFYSLVLAAERTRRKDPLDGFKTYTRGWNISERHYWAVSCFALLSHDMFFIVFIFS